MPDDKRSREDQAREAERRQREREIAAELERMDEREPPVDESALDAVEADLESLEFPATGAEVVAHAGDRAVDSADGRFTVAELVPDTEWERFGSPTAVRLRVQRPVIAVAMKRIVEASRTLRNTELDESRREAYEKTLRELEAIDADDEDEGVEVVTDWIVEQVESENRLPDSREVRRRAAEFCRSNGYQIRNDEWLGV